MTKRTVSVSDSAAVELHPNGLPTFIRWREIPDPHPEAQRLAYVLATTLLRTHTPGLTAEAVRRLRRTVASVRDDWVMRYWLEGTSEDPEEDERLYFPPFEPTEQDLAVLAWTAEFMDNPRLLDQYIEERDPQ